MRISCVLGPWVPVPLVRGGSVERIWLNLCEEFASRGHAVTLISRKFDNFPDTETVNGVQYVRLPSFGVPRSKILYRIVDIIFSWNVCRALPPSDLTITNSASLPLMLSKRRAGKIYMSLARFPKNQMSLYKRVDRVQPVSKHVGDAVRKQSPTIASLIKVIPNAISETFSCGISAHRHPRQKQVIYVGRLAREKGIHLLLRAYANISPRHPDWRLVVVGPHLTEQGGDGEEFLAALKRTCSNLKTPVTFVGPVFDENELRRRFCESEIFVYPSVASKGEALPLAPVEAMACGCAVVVSSLRCFDDYVEEGVNAIAFNEMDTTGSDLASKLEYLMDDAALRAKLGTAGLITAKNYSRYKIATHFLSDFEVVLKKES